MSNLEELTVLSNVLPPRLIEDVGRDFLGEFLATGSIESAQRLCSAVYPTSEIYSLECMPDESWMTEIWYDNLLHQGLGTTEASALTNAILGIFQGLNGGSQNEE